MANDDAARALKGRKKRTGVVSRVKREVGV